MEAVALLKSFLTNDEGLSVAQATSHHAVLRSLPASGALSWGLMSSWSGDSLNDSVAGERPAAWFDPEHSEE